jgi:hypothetical protein
MNLALGLFGLLGTLSVVLGIQCFCVAELILARLTFLSRHGSREVEGEEAWESMRELAAASARSPTPA